MRWIVAILFLANIGLAVYFNLDTLTAPPSISTNAEINPKQMVLLSQQTLEAMPKRPSVQKPTVQTAVENKLCFTWTGISQARVAEAQSELAKLSLSGEIKAQVSGDEAQKRYWVYRPPMPTLSQVMDKVAELRRLGVQEMTVVQEPPWKNTISFGLFRDEHLAQNLLEDLKSKGVKTAKMVMRNDGKEDVSLIFKEVSDTIVPQVQALKLNFPETEVTEVACTTG